MITTVSGYLYSLRIQIYLRNTSILLPLELADSSGATEAITARGDAIMIEEIRLTLEVDRAAVNGKRTRRLVGNAPFVVPGTMNALGR